MKLKISTAFSKKYILLLQTESNALHINRTLYKSTTHVEGSDL